MIYGLNNEHFLCDPDPFLLFEQMGVTDPAHAFYLGHELMKAKTALTLNKSYRQDQALAWGFLTEPEVSHLGRRKHRLRNDQQAPELPTPGAPQIEEPDEATA
jgi:hypothetical protein